MIWGFGLHIYVILLQLPQTIIINWPTTTKLFFFLLLLLSPVCAAFLISSALSDVPLCLAREMLRDVYCYLIDHSCAELKVQEKRFAIELVIGNAFWPIVVTFFLCKGKDDLLCSCHSLAILCISCQSPCTTELHRIYFLCCAKCQIVVLVWEGGLKYHYVGLYLYYKKKKTLYFIYLYTLYFISIYNI